MMPRLIEFQRPEGGPASLTVRVGDVLVLGATGGEVREGGPAAELWGPFISSVVGINGSVMEPMGPPNAVIVKAVGAGTAVLELFTGDPFHSPGSVTLRLKIVP